MALVNKIFNKIWFQLSKFSTTGPLAACSKQSPVQNYGDGACNEPQNNSNEFISKDSAQNSNLDSTTSNDTSELFKFDFNCLKILESIRTVTRPIPELKQNGKIKTCSPITRKTKPKKSISSYKQIIPDFFSKDFLRTTNIYANCPIRSYKKRSCPPAKKPWDPSDPCIRDEKRVCGQPCPKKPRNMHIPPVDDCQAQRPHPCGPVQELVKCRKISMPCCPRPYRDRCPVVKRFEKTYPPAIKPPNPCFSDYVSLYKEFICPECIYKQVDIRPHKNPLAEDEMKPRPQPYMPKIILPHLVKHTLMQKKLPRIDIHMPSVPEELAHCLGNPREIEEAKQQLAKKHRLLCEIRSMVTSYLDCPSTGGNGGGEESVKAINTARHILYNEIAKEKGTQKKIWRINMPNCPGMYRQKCEKFRPRIKCEKVRAPAPCFHECIRDEFPTQCDCECCLQPFKAKYQPVQLPGTPEMAGENYEYLLTTIKDPKDRTCAYTETRVPHSRLMEQAELMRKFPSQEC